MTADVPHPEIKVAVMHAAAHVMNLIETFPPEKLSY
jgi:hypothetical protein